MLSSVLFSLPRGHDSDPPCSLLVPLGPQWSPSLLLSPLAVLPCLICSHSYCHYLPLLLAPPCLLTAGPTSEPRIPLTTQLPELQTDHGAALALALAPPFKIHCPLTTCRPPLSSLTHSRTHTHTHHCTRFSLHLQLIPLHLIPQSIYPLQSAINLAWILRPRFFSTQTQNSVLCENPWLLHLCARVAPRKSSSALSSLFHRLPPPAITSSSPA